MIAEIKIQNNKFAAFLNGVYLGISTHRDSAKYLITYALRALDNENRIKYLEKRIRKARNNVFNYENSTRNLEKLKKELIFRRSKYSLIDLIKLKRALAIS